MIPIWKTGPFPQDGPRADIARSRTTWTRRGVPSLAAGRRPVVRHVPGRLLPEGSSPYPFATILRS